MYVGILNHTLSNSTEQRVALIPENMACLTKLGLKLCVQSRAGNLAGHSDAEYISAGAVVYKTPEEVIEKSDLLLTLSLRTVFSDSASLRLLRPGQILVGLCDAFAPDPWLETIAETGVTTFALERIPRTTRAQAMDTLSSMASLAGYKAVMLAASEAPFIFPMMSTPAGTITPARVFVLGAGVAGLQAIATARRLGAVVTGWDVRPATREQVESLGARFAVFDQEISAEGHGGYARALNADELARQRSQLTPLLAQSDVIITTAAIPGKEAPLLITAEMISALTQGSVLIDLAAERGGNCELTQPGQTVRTRNGVIIIGPVNLPATLPMDASRLYARNLVAFVQNLFMAPPRDVVQPHVLKIAWDDDIVAASVVTRGGQLVGFGKPAAQLVAT